MDIIKILKLLTDYGVTILITSVFLYVVIRICNIWLTKYERNVLGKDHDELLQIRAEVGSHIQSQITDYLKSTKCSRVQIIEFSNSVMSVAYLPFKYMTCTYEVHELGISGSGHKIDRLSTSLFTPFFDQLQSSKCRVFFLGDSVIGGAMGDLFNCQGVDKVLCTMLYSRTGKAIGYVQATKDTEFTANDIQEMKELGESISTLLCVVDK